MPVQSHVMRDTPTHVNSYSDTPTPCSSPQSDSSTSTDSTLSDHNDQGSTDVTDHNDVTASDTDTEPVAQEARGQVKTTHGNLGFSRSANWFGSGSGSGCECRTSKRPGVGRCARKPLPQRRGGGWEGQAGAEHGLRLFNIRVSKSCTKECEVLRPGHLYSEPFVPAFDSGSIYREIFRSSDSINDASDLGVDCNDPFNANAPSPSNRNLAALEERGESVFQARSSQLSLGLDSSAEGDSWNNSDDAPPQGTLSSASNLATPTFCATDQLSSATPAERGPRELDAEERALREDMSSPWGQGAGCAHGSNSCHTSRTCSVESKVTASTPLSSEASLTTVTRRGADLEREPEVLVAAAQAWRVGPFPCECASEPACEKTTWSGLESGVAREAATEPRVSPVNLSPSRSHAALSFSLSTSQRTQLPGGAPLPTEIEAAISTAMRKGAFHRHEADRPSAVCEPTDGAASSCSLNACADGGKPEGDDAEEKGESAVLGSPIPCEIERTQETNWTAPANDMHTQNGAGFSDAVQTGPANVLESPAERAKPDTIVPVQQLHVDLEVAAGKLQVTVPTGSPAENNSNNKGGLGDLDSSPQSPDTKSCEEVASILLSPEEAPLKERASNKKTPPAPRNAAAWAEGGGERKSKDSKASALEAAACRESGAQAAAHDDEASPRLAAWIPAPEYLGFLDTLKRRHRHRREKKMLFRKRSPRVSPDGEPLNMVMEFQERDLTCSPPAFPKGHECPDDWRPGEHSDNYITQLSAEYKTERLRDMARRRRKMNLRKKRKTARSPAKKAESVARESRRGSSAVSLNDSNTEDGTASSRSLGRSTYTTLTGRSDDVSSASEWDEAECKGYLLLDSDTRESRRRGAAKPKRITSEVTLLKTLEDYLQLSDDSNSETDTAPIQSPSKQTSNDGVSTRMSCSLPLIAKPREKNAKAGYRASKVIALRKHSEENAKLACKLPLIKRTRPRIPKSGIRISKMFHHVPSIMDSSRLREIGARDQLVSAKGLEGMDRWDYNIHLAYKEEEEEAAAKPSPLVKKTAHKLPSGKRAGKKSGGVKSGRGQGKVSAQEFKVNTEPKVVTYLDLLFPQRAHAWAVPSQQKEELGLRESQASEGPLTQSFPPASRARDNPGPEFPEENQGGAARFARHVTWHPPEPRPEQTGEPEVDGAESKSRPKVVRFADQTRRQGRKSPDWMEEAAGRGEEDDEWCYSVNAMLLRAKQVGRASRPAQTSDHKFPRPESANVIPPLLNNHSTSSSFLSELLKQDMHERRQAAKASSQASPRSNKSSRTHARGHKLRPSNNSGNNSYPEAKPKVLKYIDFPSELPLNSFPNLPPNSQASQPRSAAVLTIKTKLSKRAQERALRVEERNASKRAVSPHYSPPTPESLQEKANLVGVRYTRPLTSRNLERETVRLLKDQAMRRVPDASCRAFTQTIAQPPQAKSPELSPPRRRGPGVQNSYLLDQQSDTFKYFRSPHLQHRHTSVVQLYARNDNGNVNANSNNNNNSNNSCSLAWRGETEGRHSDGHVRHRCGFSERKRRGREGKRRGREGKKRCLRRRMTGRLTRRNRTRMKSNRWKSISNKLNKHLYRNGCRQYNEKEGLQEETSMTVECLDECSPSVKLTPLLSDYNNNASPGREDSDGSGSDSKDGQRSEPRVYRPVSTDPDKNNEEDSTLDNGTAGAPPRPVEEERDDNMSSWEMQLFGQAASWTPHEETWTLLTDHFLQVPNTSRASSRGNPSLASACSEQDGERWKGGGALRSELEGDRSELSRWTPASSQHKLGHDESAWGQVQDLSDVPGDDVTAPAEDKPEDTADGLTVCTSPEEGPGHRRVNAQLQASLSAEVRDQECNSDARSELATSFYSMQAPLQPGAHPAASSLNHMEKLALGDGGVLNSEKPYPPKTHSNAADEFEQLQETGSKDATLLSHNASEETEAQACGSQCEAGLSCFDLLLLCGDRRWTDARGECKDLTQRRRCLPRNPRLRQSHWLGRLSHRLEHKPAELGPFPSGHCLDLMVTGRALLPTTGVELRRNTPGHPTPKQGGKPERSGTREPHAVGRIQRVENILNRQRNALDTRREVYPGSQDENEEETPQGKSPRAQYEHQMEAYQKIFDDFHEEFWQHDLQASDRFCWKKVIVPPPFSKPREPVEVSAQSSSHSWKNVFQESCGQSCGQSLYTSTEGDGDRSEQGTSLQQQQNKHASSDDSDNEWDFRFPPPAVSSKVNSFRLTKKSKRFMNFGCAWKGNSGGGKAAGTRKNRSTSFNPRASKNKEEASAGKEGPQDKDSENDKELPVLRTAKPLVSSETQVFRPSQDDALCLRSHVTSAEAFLQHPGSQEAEYQLPPGRGYQHVSPRAPPARPGRTSSLWRGLPSPRQPFPTLSFLQSLRTPDIVRDILLDADLLLRSLHAVTRKELYLPTFRLRSSEPVVDVSPMVVKLLQCAEEDHVVPMSRWECEPSTVRSMPVFFTHGDNKVIESIFTVGRVFQGLYSLEDQEGHESSKQTPPAGDRIPRAKVKAARLVQYPQKGLTPALTSKCVMLVGSPTLTRHEALDFLQVTQDSAAGRLQHYLEKVCGWRYHLPPRPSRPASGSESAGTSLSGLFHRGPGSVSPDGTDGGKSKEGKEKEEDGGRSLTDDEAWGQARRHDQHGQHGAAPAGGVGGAGVQRGEGAWGAGGGFPPATHRQTCERCGVLVHQTPPEQRVNSPPQWEVSDGIAMKISTQFQTTDQSSVTRGCLEKNAVTLPRLSSVAPAHTKARGPMSSRSLSQSAPRLPLVHAHRKAMSATSLRRMYDRALAWKGRHLGNTTPAQSSSQSLKSPSSWLDKSVTDTTEDPASKYPRHEAGSASSRGLSPWWTKPIEVPSFRRRDTRDPYALHATKLRQINRRYVSPYWTQKKAAAKPRRAEKEEDSWSGYKDRLSDSVSSSSSSSSSSSDDDSSSQASEASEIDLDTYTGPRSISDIFQRILPGLELVKRARLVRERRDREGMRNEPELADFLRTSGKDTDVSFDLGSELRPVPETEVSGPKRGVGGAGSEFDMCEDVAEVKALWAQMFPDGDFWTRHKKKSKVQQGMGLLPWSLGRPDSLGWACGQ